jgi:AraC-like DNA-binding protein
MDTRNISPPDSIARYVSNILVYNEEDNNRSVLPFFADGYPGLIIHNATNRMMLFPSGQMLKNFFIYGQTLNPIELVIDGRFQMVIFQLFPFALRGLFKLGAQSLNEDCYDLTLVEAAIAQLLENEDNPERQVSIITEFLSHKIMAVTDQDDLIKESINLILASNGTLSIKAITEKLHVSERSLQRLFKSETGISPKRFCKIIQFQASLAQLYNDNYLKLGQIAYEKGFADQSHFIRVFRKYTGHSPSSFTK